MNTTISNPVASVASVVAMNRPVILQDVAEKLGMPLKSVQSCMQKNSKMAKAKIDLVYQTAQEMGYDKSAVYRYYGKKGGETHKGMPREYKEKVCVCGKPFLSKSGNQTMCFECRQVYLKNYYHVYNKVHNGRSMNYRNGNFKTREEEIARMNELRAMGYSNQEIAKAIGRSRTYVLNNIGIQDIELSKQNRAMAQHIIAQKNAARKQYVINKPIREYNKRVDEHNRMKAELAQLQLELLEQKPGIVQAAQTKISFPLIDLHTVQPTALQ